MTIEEQASLDRMKAEIQTEKLRVHDYMRHLIQTPTTELITCGYRNGLAAALEDVMRTSLKKIKRITDAHIKQYPD